MSRLKLRKCSFRKATPPPTPIAGMPIPAVGGGSPAPRKRCQEYFLLFSFVGGWVGVGVGEGTWRGVPQYMALDTPGSVCRSRLSLKRGRTFTVGLWWQWPVLPPPPPFREGRYVGDRRMLRHDRLRCRGGRCRRDTITPLGPFYPFPRTPPPKKKKHTRRLEYQGRPWAGKDPVLKGTPSSLKGHLHGSLF